MQIIWHGQSLFEIITIPQKNSQLRIVINPFSEEIGLKLPKLETDIVLISSFQNLKNSEMKTCSYGHYNHNNIKGVLESPFLIEGPGEYEIKGVFIQGIQAWNDEKKETKTTIYTIESEELKICHLGDLGQKELTSEQLEKIGEIDILMIPTGGIGTISAKEAVNIISQIEPKITIPMNYALPKLKIKLEGVDNFLKNFGIKKIEPLAKLSIKKKDLSEEEAKIILLKP